MSHVRTVIVSVVALACVVSAGADQSLAQERSHAALADSARKVLPDDALADFRTRRLSIQLIGREESSYDQFSQAEGGRWYRWKVYRGEDPMTEEDFLSEAGHYRYAQEAASFHRDARHNFIAGIFLTVLGGAAAYIGYNMEDFIDNQHGPSRGMIGAGITVSGLGIGLSVSSGLKKRRQWASFDRAYDITREYNQQLLEELEEGR